MRCSTSWRGLHSSRWALRRSRTHECRDGSFGTWRAGARAMGSRVSRTSSEFSSGHPERGQNTGCRFRTAMSFSPQAIVALDVGSLREARALVEQLGDGAGFYKVGLQLFSAEGPRVVDWLQASGKRVFLDLKLHDIPRTVARATENARRLGAALVTVHGLGGGAAARAAVDAAGDETGILLVTVLTSFDAAS